VFARFSDNTVHDVRVRIKRPCHLGFPTAKPVTGVAMLMNLIATDKHRTEDEAGSSLPVIFRSEKLS